MKFYLQSFNDIVTNSSMEVYQEATEYTVESIKEIINIILKIAKSDKKCDDLFTVYIDYENMFEDYFEDIAERCNGNEELERQFDEIQTSRESYSVLYNKYLGMITANGFPTIEEFVRNYDSKWRYPSTEVRIIPKVPCTNSELKILDRINDLFNLEGQYDG